MSEICINVIGAGHWGPNIIRTFSSLPGVRVGCVADLDAARLQVVGQNFPGLRVTADAGAAVEDPSADAVAIITPVSTHFALAKRALEAGKHVFVEKPISKRSEEAAELIEMAARFGRTLMVGHIFLYNPGIVKIKAILDSGALGRVYYIDAVRTNLGPIRRDVNALWDLASHDFAIFDYWLGARPERISATGLRVSEKNVEDVVFASVHYEGGAMAHVHASWLNPRKVRQITVVGEEKMVVWDDVDFTRSVQIYSHGVRVDKEGYSDTFGTHRLKYHTGDLLIPKVDSAEPLKVECAHFVECVRDGVAPRTDGASAKRVVDVLHAADRSLAADGACVGVEA